jgi:hypothetical protein
MNIFLLIFTFFLLNSLNTRLPVLFSQFIVIACNRGENTVVSQAILSLSEEDTQMQLLTRPLLKKTYSSGLQTPQLSEKQRLPPLILAGLFVAVLIMLLAGVFLLAP